MELVEISIKDIHAYLISSVRAAQAAQAARTKKCFVWDLSEREKEIIKQLDEKEGGESG